MSCFVLRVSCLVGRGDCHLGYVPSGVRGYCRAQVVAIQVGEGGSRLCLCMKKPTVGAEPAAFICRSSAQISRVLTMPDIVLLTHHVQTEG